MLWSIGIITTLGLSAMVGDLGRLGGQIMFAHVGVVALIVLVLRLTIPESAVWLSAREERLTGVRTERAVRSNLRFLFTKPYLVPFVSLLVFYALVNLAANTGGQFGTYLWVNAAGSTVQVSSLVSLAVWPLALILSGVFMRIVDTKYRMRFFYVGLVAYVLSPLVPAVFGVSVPTLILNSVFGAIGGALAFEAIMKVWTQESFPTLLRTTAQGTIIAVARVMAAGLALVTPNLIAHGPTTLFVFLTVVMIIGMAAAVLAFRHGTRNEFRIETRLVGDDRPAEPVVSAA